MTSNGLDPMTHLRGGGQDPDWSALRAALPGLGYFGALDSDCLEVPIGESVTAITLSVCGTEPTFLNLSGVELYRDGLLLVPGELDYEAEISSSVHRAGTTSAGQLLCGKGIHSGAEVTPSWRVQFAEPVEVSRIRIRNRADLWGLRSRTLRVVVQVPSRGEILVHDSSSRDAAVESLAIVGHGALGIDALSDALLTVDDAVRVRGQLLAQLAQKLRAGSLSMPETPWRHVAQLLDLWSTREPTDDEWTVLSGLLLAQHARKRGTAIRAFCRPLNSRQRLGRLEKEVNALAATYGLQSLSLTRHGFSPVGKLAANPAKFLDHLEGTLRVLDDMGRMPVLAYGTLLGAVRESRFIPHDDDVDLLYASRGKDRESVVADLMQLRAQLQSMGYRVDLLLPNNLNMHVFHPRTGALVDVFPCWIEEAGLMLHMEAMKIRPIRPDIVHPGTSVELHGRIFPAPADPVAFLEERYGAAWKVSDPYFEWPWKLEDSVE